MGIFVYLGVNITSGLWAGAGNCGTHHLPGPFSVMKQEVAVDLKQIHWILNWNTLLIRESGGMLIEAHRGKESSSSL